MISSCVLEQHWQSPTRLPDTARYKLALPRAILDDPAFSSDPRSHPHFPLADAASYRASPPRIPLPDLPPSPSSPSSLSLSSSDSLSSSSPSPSPSQLSATSLSQSQTRFHVSPPPSLSPEKRISPPPIQHSMVTPKPPSRHYSPLVPGILPRSDGTKIPARHNIPPATFQNANIPRKGRMKALVRRLTSRHNLDRIDELDETDPSGVGYHHDGPYEAIGSNLIQPSLPPRTTLLRGGSVHRSNQREFHPHPLRPGQRQSASRVSSTHGETGLSLNLEPGQILQRNTVYSPQVPSMTLLTSRFPSQTNAIAIFTPLDHSRSSSLPNIRTWSPDDIDDSLSLESLNGYQGHPSSSSHVPRVRYSGDNTTDKPNNLPLRDSAPHVPQTETAVFPPPRRESRSRSSGPPRSSQHTPPSLLYSTSRKPQIGESAVSALARDGLQHKSVHSLDSSYETDSTITQSSSGIQNKPLEPPRIRHLPKRLVMPAPLQPQPSQLQHKLPPAEAAAWSDRYLGDESVQFEVRPATYTQKLGLVRSRSTAFPAKTLVPVRVAMPQDDAVPIMRDSPTKTVKEAEGTKEKIRRRRLSKRKNDN